MRWNIFALNGESNISKRVKNVSYRSLRMESLEKRELLSAAPADDFRLLDGEGKLTGAGWLVYRVVENETANRSTCIHVNGVQLGGDGGADMTRVFVAQGDALPSVTNSGEILEDLGVLQTIRIEDWKDGDYNDLVVEVTFEPLTIGPITPGPCEPCSCATGVNIGVNSSRSEYLTMPEDSGSVDIRVESVFPTIGGITPQPQMMTATLQYGNQTKTVYYDTSTFDPSDVFTVGMDLDTSTMTSGRYDWTMTLTYDYGNNVTQTQTFTGAEDVVNRSASPYGSGLNLTELSSLNLTNLNALTNRGINWERSCGKQVWFSYDGSSFTPEAGESAESTLVQNLNGTYTLVDQGETFFFNAAGQLLTRTNNLTDKTVTWTYNLDGTAATKTDEANRVTTYQYTNGKLASVTDSAGRTTAYQYDSLGRLTSVTEPDPDGNGSLTSLVTSYTYDGNSSRIATITDASGNVTAYTYSSGQVVSKTVNGITQSTQDPFILSAIIDTTVTGYDVDHLADLPKALETNGLSTNLSGNQTEYRYDTFGNVIWQRTASGVETSFLYDTNGRLRKETESVMVNGRSQGHSTEYGYDVNGNLIKIKYYDGSTEEWTYDANFNQMLSYKDQSGNRTLYTFDSSTGLTLSERRVVGQVDSTANGETDDVVTTYSYNTNRTLASVTNALGVVTSYTYDSHGNVLTETTGSATTTYTYDSADRRTSVTNALNQTTSYTYDNLDRLVQTTYSNGQTSQSVYNNAGQLVQTIDLNGAVTSYTYNASGKIAAIVSPGSSVSYTYDSLGRVSTETDSLNRVTTYTYNAGGKLASTTISDVNAQSAVISQTTYDAWGRTATQTDATGVTLTYNYDKFDRVTSITRTNDNVVLETRTYDKAGNLKTVWDAAGAVTTYTYDSLGNVTQIKAADNSTTSFTYDKLGRVLTQTDALGNVTSYTYDIYGNLVSTTDALNHQTTSTYNAIGQQVSYTDALNNVTTYTYDALGRVTSTTLTSANGDTYTTGDNNELTSDGTWSYTYDAEGNRISKTNATNRELYTWDHRNRLTTVTQQEWDSVEQDWVTTQIVEYAYDYNNVWIRKVIGTDKTIFIPENYQTTVQIDNNAVTHHYLWTPNQQDKLLADTTPNSTSWALTDHLGTVRDILAATTTHLIYDAFGNLTSGTNPLLFGYTGKAFDADTALQNNINRWYDATTGRWLSADPIGFNGNDTNLYRYVENTVTGALDFYGMAVDTLTASIEKCLKIPYPMAQIKCLEDILWYNGGNCRKVQAIINKIRNTPVGDLISGKLKRSASYASELAGKSMVELEKLAKGHGELAKKASQMLKLVKESKRLMEKL